MAWLAEKDSDISFLSEFFANKSSTYSNHPENVSYMLKTTQNPLATIYQHPQNHVGKFCSQVPLTMAVFYCNAVLQWRQAHSSLCF